VTEPTLVRPHEHSVGFCEPVSSGRDAFERARLTIVFARSVEECFAIVQHPVRLQTFALRTDINVLLSTVGEVAARERAVISCALVPDRDVRRDGLALEPAQWEKAKGK